MKVSVVLTDLDGTLLSRDGRLEPEVRQVLRVLAALKVPVVPLTSKTEVELREWLAEIDGGGVGAFENGAGVVTPEGTEIHPGALPVARLREALGRARAGAGVEARCIDEIPMSELEDLMGLKGHALDSALRRDYDLPFQPRAEGKEPLRRALESLDGIRLTEGGIFWHLTGAHDKGDAARTILGKLARPGLVVGLGDAANDAAFLSIVDLPVVVPGRNGPSPALRERFPRARIAPQPLGEGWTAAIRALLEEDLPPGSSPSAAA